MTSKRLVPISELKKLVENNEIKKATARTFKHTDGHFLELETENETLVLSTYLSDNPRWFKRSDALIKECKKLGLTFLGFDLVEENVFE